MENKPVTLDELKELVSQLPRVEFNEFREWFLRFEGEHWDEQLEIDIASGRLDSLAQVALKNFRDGLSESM
ncbi:hypothetical protein SH501x_004498 [Pirellulaceae bacterium SH501]